VKTRSTCIALLALAAFASASVAQDHKPAKPADGHAADAHAPAGGGNIFAGDLGNMIWTTIIFGIVVVILGTKAWPVILKTLHEREEAIRGSLEKAAREREEAEKLLAKYREQIDKARVEATAIVEEGRRDAAETRRRLQEEAAKESAEMIARARQEVKLAADTAIKELYDRTAELAVQVAGSIVSKELNPDDHRRLVTESLERMKVSKN
jgi:F-type H+-transporting ATPase subunit b